MFGTSIRLLALLVGLAMPASAQVIEDFGAGAERRWVYVADRVMGGVSTGAVSVANGIARLTGQVSTANNGGFIQMRWRFGGGWSRTAQGLTLRVKGNGARYYVFLRTAGLSRPWYSYRASFDTKGDWTDVALPFERFSAARDEMPQDFTPDQVISLGLVAYGRDHEADLSVASISIY